MILTDRMTQYALDLMRIDSLSRMEMDVALKLKADMEELGAECVFDNSNDKVDGNVGNLIIKLKGNKPEVNPFFLSAHMDTVGPGEGVKPHIEGRVIRSDGTTILGSDDKSGLAVIVEVLRTLKENDLPHGDIEIAFTICEEVGLLGAKHMNTSGFKSPYGIVLDSSSPSYLVLQCPSSEILEFRVYGLEAHAGLCPERGINAIKVAGDAISKMSLGRIDEETTANLGIITGGATVNVVPNCVHIVGEVRSHSEEKLRTQVDHMRRCFDEAAAHYEIVLDGEKETSRVEEVIERMYEKMDVSNDSTPARLVNQAVKSLGHAITPRKIGGGCDANYFNLKGIECVNLGTGMKDIHTVNEHLVLEEFYRTADILLETIQLNARPTN
ncbi:MAG: M20/M25/M40 family metallo-hydrolase [Candidatus Dadabacteria bacterium]|nr:M20/M25/M40 family metallo-hydrolase [Candidatus Dadabacteria bacterium]